MFWLRSGDPYSCSAAVMFKRWVCEPLCKAEVDIGGANMDRNSSNLTTERPTNTPRPWEMPATVYQIELRHGRGRKDGMIDRGAPDVLYCSWRDGGESYRRAGMKHKFAKTWGNGYCLLRGADSHSHSICRAREWTEGGF
jgi:hypothetical protein